MNRRCAIAGLSLVELMVAITLGMLLLLAVTGLHARVSRLAGDTSAAAETQDALRIAMAVVEYELAHADHWAIAADATAISGRSAGPAPLAVDVAGDCGPGWATDLDQALAAWSDTWPLACPPFGGSAALGDVLVLRRADTRRSAPDPGVLQLYLDPWGGRLVVSGEPLGAGEEARDLVSRVYYVSPHSTGDASRPSLRRKTLQRGPRVVDEELVAGIGRLQILFGEDLDPAGWPGHGLPNRFVPPAALTGRPVAVRIRLQSDGAFPLATTRTVPLRNETAP